MSYTTRRAAWDNLEAARAYFFQGGPEQMAVNHEAVYTHTAEGRILKGAVEIKAGREPAFFQSQTEERLARELAATI